MIMKEYIVEFDNMGVYTDNFETKCTFNFPPIILSNEIGKTTNEPFKITLNDFEFLSYITNQCNLQSAQTILDDDYKFILRIFDNYENMVYTLYKTYIKKLTIDMENTTIELEVIFENIATY